MSKKFCPLGFFSFYVNKSQAQAGAAHHCVEEACALWNEEYGECSIKVGLDSIVSVAENFSGQGSPKPTRQLEFEAPKHSIFDKLRKKLPTVEQPQPTPSPVVSVTPSPQLPITTVPLHAIPPQKEPEPNNTESLLKPPSIPVEALPIISSEK